MRSDELPFSLGTTQPYNANQDFALSAGREYMITDDNKFIPEGGRAATDLKKRVRLVRNVSGQVLLPKRAVKFKSGSNMTEVDGYANVTNEVVAGIVDEFISTSVADGEWFFITIEGPTLFVNDPAASANNFYAIGDKLSAVTAAASTSSTTSGRLGKPTVVAPTDVASAGSFSNIVNNWVVTALSASTTANTNAEKLGLVHYPF
jgi:hypothetical protein